MDIFTTATNNYMTVFSNYLNIFTEWGKWIFFSLLTINLVWLCMWKAFDHKSFEQSMPKFLKEFIVIAIFYTIMINPHWMVLAFQSVESMGSTLTHAGIDPSSIISQGIGLGNKLIIPVEKASILTLGFSMFVILIVYLFLIYVYINIAIDLAVTMVITTALITISTFFLGFAALGATKQIARTTLDTILANCVKMLGIYVVVASGSSSIDLIVQKLPNDIVSFDPYMWVAAVVGLFYVLAKSLPNQLAKIFSGSFQESHGVDAAAVATAAVSLASHMNPALKVASAAAQTVAKLAGSTGYSAAGHFKASMSSGASVGASLGAAVGGSMGGLARASGSKLTDHFKDITSKMAGGNGADNPIKSVAERMNAGGQVQHDFAQKGEEKNALGQKINNATPDSASAYAGRGQPNSAGMRAASPSALRSKPPSKK